jgi:hypothetical protein
MLVMNIKDQTRNMITLAAIREAIHQRREDRKAERYADTYYVRPLDEQASDEGMGV